MPITIKLSKKKIFVILVGSTIFSLIGSWFIVSNIILLNIIGWITLLFFGTSVVYAIYKLFDSSPGLVIDEYGINDNSSGIAAGFIPWSDIRTIVPATMNDQQFLIIHVNNPEVYINKGTFLVQKARQFNYDLYGSPLAISATALNYSFNDLQHLCIQYLTEYGQFPVLPQQHQQTYKT